MARRRLLAAVVVVTTLGGCAGGDEVPLTREPDPPLDLADWTVVWIAAFAAGLVVGAHLVRRVQGRRRRAARRVVAGWVFASGLLVPFAWWVYEIGRRWRAEVILDWRDCRELPLDERPVQIVQLSCVTDLDFAGRSVGLDRLTVFGLIVLTTITLAAVTLALVCLAGVLRHERASWTPAIVATSIAVVLAIEAGASVGETTTGGGWAALLAALVAFAIAAVACWGEVLAARAAAAGRSRRDGPRVAIDRSRP